MYMRTTIMNLQGLPEKKKSSVLRLVFRNNILQMQNHNLYDPANVNQNGFI